jgi:transposase-like protein
MNETETNCEPKAGRWFSAAERQQLIKEYEESGLNQTEFARLRGLRPGTFRQWVMRHGSRREMAPIKPTELREVNLGQLLCGSPWAAEVVLKNQTTLRFSAQVQWPLVAQLLERLA